MNARPLLLLAAALRVSNLYAALPIVTVPEFQPFAAQVRRVLDALEVAGSPLTPAQKSAVQAALTDGDPGIAAAKIQSILDGRCLFGVNINPEMRVKVAVGDAKPELIETGWKTFLVKVHNESGTTAELKATSPQAERLHNAPAAQVADRWLGMEMYTGQPLKKELGGLPLEYRVVQLYSRDVGKREAKISFNVGQGTQDLGFRSEADVLFNCVAARTVQLKIIDETGKPCTAALKITDSQGHVYPAPAKRLAPDFFFHPQVYRADGETLKLPEGSYTVEFRRGPESVREVRSMRVGNDGGEWSFAVKRWIDPSKMGWWSGDHHIHAAGCAHYEKPTEGVHADDMMRHVLGEDLKIGCNLTWGPCFDYQKQFFTGKDDKVSILPYLLHYDVEVSGFGSHESGHLCLLKLREQMYPGGDSKHHWPKLGLNTLKWAKKQGALVGPAHSGWGLEMDSTQLPNFDLPKFNGIGANEYIVDVTHEIPGPDGKLVPAVDFISTVDTPYPWELNIWYQTLNAGFRTRASGETDFPCIYAERVGLGRSYVKLDGPIDYFAWCEGIRDGRNYVSDGYSHLMDFRVDDVKMGVNGSELRLDGKKRVKARVKVAARLDQEPEGDIQSRKFTSHPYWHIERARVKGTRTVPVELIQNGFPVATKMIQADGVPQDLEFDVEITRSSWLAVRILPSAHSNPVFVVVDGKPIRAFRRSLNWCLQAVENCWNNKERFMKGEERVQAQAAYDHAREVYKQRLAECEWD